MTSGTWRGQARFWAGEYRRRGVDWAVGRLSPDTSLLVLQALERRGSAPRPVLDAHQALFRSLVVSSEVVAEGRDIVVEPHIPGESSDGHHWNDVRVHRVRDVTIDSTTGLVFHGKRVLGASTNGGPGALHSALMSGAATRVAELRPVARIAGPVALAGNPVNYYHFMTDTVPRLLGVVRTYPDVRVLLSSSRPAFVAETFRSLGIATELLTEPAPVTCDDVLLCDAWPMQWPHPELIAAVRDELWSAAGDVPSSFPERVYLSRSGSSRSIHDEQSVESHLAEDGFTALRLEELAVPEQVARLRSATLVVAPHGAGLTNLMFMRPGATVIELVTGEWWSPCFRNLAAICGVRHHLAMLSRTPEHPHGYADDVVPVVRRAIAAVGSP